GSGEAGAGMRWIRGNSRVVRRIGKLLIRVERLIAEEPEYRTVDIIRSGFRDYVDGSSLRPAVDRREALGGHLEFLHGFRRKLHDRAANRVVFVVDSVDADIHVAAALAVYG